jgi:hypothetical protein
MKNNEISEYRDTPPAPAGEGRDGGARKNSSSLRAIRHNRIFNKLWIGLGILAILSPLGLFLPDAFRAGSAWGEWSPDEVKDIIGYIPIGLENLSNVWHSVLPDYAFKGWEEKGLGQLSLAYIISAVIGIALCVGAAWLLGKLLARKEK